MSADPLLTLQLVVQLALADARRFGPEPQVLRAESVTWPDAGLGCPQAGMAYAQVLVPGYRVLLRVGERELHYHAARRGEPRLCPADRVQRPVPDGSR